MLSKFLFPNGRSAAKVWSAARQLDVMAERCGDEGVQSSEPEKDFQKNHSVTKIIAKLLLFNYSCELMYECAT